MGLSKSVVIAGLCVAACGQPQQPVAEATVPAEVEVPQSIAPPEPVPPPPVGTDDQKVAAFRQSLTQVFHSLPPPEILDTQKVPCPPALAPQNGELTLPIIDARLLRFFVDGLPRLKAVDGKLPPQPELDEHLDLNSPLFIRLHAYEREQIIASTTKSPHKPNNIAAALIPGITTLEAGDRLLILLEQPPSSETDDPYRLTFRSYVAAHLFSSKRGLCFFPIEVDVPMPGDEVVAPEVLNRAIRKAVDQHLAQVQPGLHAYTGD